MEIFQSIANNFIKRGNRQVAMALVVSLMAILCVGCSRMSGELPSTQTRGAKTQVDAISQAASRPNDDSRQPEEGTILSDVNGMPVSPEEEEAILREHNRTETDTRFFVCRKEEGTDWSETLFDLVCKLSVSESKVRQGIFHFRLQSDDEEAPLLRRIA